MRVVGLAQADAFHIARNLRASDLEEMAALSFSTDPLELVDEIVERCLSGGSFAWAAGIETPIAMIGGVPLHPGVWRMWMMATDDWQQIALGLTKFAHRVIIPALRDVGAHRMEAITLSTHKVSHRWMRHFGAKREGTLKGFGRDGQDFYTYVIHLEG